MDEKKNDKHLQSVHYSDIVIWMAIDQIPPIK